MKSLPSKGLKMASIVGLLCLFVPVIILGLWIHAFNLGSTQINRVEIFTRYFPESFNGRLTITFLSMAFCILTIILSGISLTQSEKLWKAMNFFTLVLGLLLLLMNLFQIM